MIYYQYQQNMSNIQTIKVGDNNLAEKFYPRGDDGFYSTCVFTLRNNEWIQTDGTMLYRLKYGGQELLEELNKRGNVYAKTIWSYEKEKKLYAAI
jgi:hypothetical protein